MKKEKKKPEPLRLGDGWGRGIEVCEEVRTFLSHQNICSWL